MSGLSTHVLDAMNGTPAAGVAVSLFGTGAEALTTTTTDVDGRVPELAPGPLEPGVYRLSFDTGSYFAELDVPTFYPEVSISFTVTSTDAHYHVPLLLSPYAYSTYRGS